MTTPVVEIRRISCVPSSTIWIAATSPVFAPSEARMTPWPPRPCVGKSSTAVRLPNPFSVTDRIWVRGRAIPIPMTSSPLERRIPVTPWVWRPIGRASVALNVIALPLRVAMTMRSLSPAPATQARRSALRGRNALKPGRGDVAVLGERRLLHEALAGRHHQVRQRRTFPDRDERRYPLAGLHRLEDVLDRSALRGAARVRELVGLEGEDAAAVGEDVEPVVVAR